MSRRAFVVAGIVECLQPDRGRWELIDSHGAGIVVCPFITGRGIGTETCEMDNVFPPDDLQFGLDTYDSLYEYIYNCVFGSLISDVKCNYVSADGVRDGLWWPALPGHWLSYTGCWLSLLVMYWLLCLGCCFYFNHIPRMFLSTDFAFLNNGLNMLPWTSFTCYTKDNQQGCFRLCNWFSLRRLGPWMNHLPPAW